MEIEVKLRLKDAESARRQLSRLGARTLGRVHERDVLFDTTDNVLQRSGRLLRVRILRKIGRPGRAGAGAKRFAAAPGMGVLTYKGPPEGGRYKAREEVEVTIDRPEAAERILAELGFQPWFRYEKFRTSFRLSGLPRLAVELDETPIGVFYELEGPRDCIDRAAGRLGFGAKDYVTASYYDLFLPEHRRLGLRPDAMLFPAST